MLVVVDKIGVAVVDGGTVEPSLSDRVHADPNRAITVIRAKALIHSVRPTSRHINASMAHDHHRSRHYPPIGNKPPSATTRVASITGIVCVP